MKTIFASAVAKNIKQENAILALNDIDYNYEYDANADSEYTQKIYNFLNENGFEYKTIKSDPFYFTSKIPCGDVRGYKNCSITNVNISSEYAVCFDISFDVENPFQDEINELSPRKYTLNDVERERLNEIKVYVPNFTYCYSQSLNADILKNVYEAMILAENIERSKYAAAINDERFQLFYKVMHKKATYAETVRWWDVQDELEDIKTYHIASAEELEIRETRRNTTEEEYNNRDKWWEK